MKKRKILGATLLSVVMCISMFATGAFGQQTKNQESFRVLVQGPASEKAKAKYFEFYPKGCRMCLSKSQRPVRV